MHIILKDINAIDRRDRQYGIAFELDLRLSIPLLHNGEIPLQNSGKEIAGAADQFKEAGFDAFCFLFRQIEHGVDLAFPGQHLAMIGHPLS